MKFSAPVEAGTLKLRNRGFAHKSDFYAKKYKKKEPTLSLLGQICDENRIQNGVKN